MIKREHIQLRRFFPYWSPPKQQSSIVFKSLFIINSTKKIQIKLGECRRSNMTPKVSVLPGDT